MNALIVIPSRRRGISPQRAFAGVSLTGIPRRLAPRKDTGGGDNGHRTVIASPRRGISVQPTFAGASRTGIPRRFAPRNDTGREAT
jgi:hypothetical protein